MCGTGQSWLAITPHNTHTLTDTHSRTRTHTQHCCLGAPEQAVCLGVAASQCLLHTVTPCLFSEAELTPAT